MQIVETNIQFKGALSHRKTTKRAIIHHSASADVSASTIHGWHLGNGWSGIGYHFIIRKDGTIERGRPEWAIGSHSGPKGNGDSIGIVLTGNFETGEPTAAQMNALVWLLNDYLFVKYGELKVIGHKDVMPTACPGKLFPWDELRKRLEEDTVAEHWKEKLVDDAIEVGLITERHNPDETAAKWFVLAVAMNLLKAVRGGK